MAVDSIISKIEASRKELLDLGLRNPLLNYRALKSRGVEVVDEIPATVFDILVHKERRMSFLPRPDDDEDYELGQPEYDDDNPDVLAPRYTDNRLQTNEPSNRLQARLLNTYYTANTVIQEQGMNTLFMALGMVEWYESGTSEIARRAPLILVPVEIERSDIRGRFHISYTGEELGANLSFIERVQSDFSIDIPGLPENEDINVNKYFTDISNCIKEMRQWSVDTTSVVLGFFSFSKLLMYRDLDSENWPAGTGPLESETVRALFEEGFTEPESEIGDEDHLDDHLCPEDTHHVVDADSSQALAISDVATGRNLVIQGPPGTGKSQTITNVIAAAISRNKKVLFVSEKMAALEVVKRRLDGLQLGDACLELHSHKTTKRAVLDELRRTWELGRPDIAGMENDFVALARLQSSLNEYAEAVNTPVGNTGVTPFRAYGELLCIQNSVDGDNSLPRPEIAGIDSWSRAVFTEKRNVVANLQRSLGRVGTLKQHLFRDCQLQVVLPLDQASLREKINTALRSLETLVAAIRALSTILRLNVPEDIPHTRKLLFTAERVIGAPDIGAINIGAAEWKERRGDIGRLRDSGCAWADLHAKYDAVLDPRAWDSDMRQTRDILATVGRKFQKFVYPQFHISPANPSISEERIDTAAESLRVIIESTRDLSDALGLRSPEDMTEAGVLLLVAEHARRAPDIEGVDLAALEPQTQREEIKRLVAAGNSWAKLHSDYDDFLEPMAWDADMHQTRDTLATVGRKFWRLVSPEYRRAKRHLSSLCSTELYGNVERWITIAEAILEEQELRKTIERISSVAGAVLGPKWRGTESDWEAISRIVGWALSLLDDVDSGKIALDVVRSLRDDIDAVRIRDLLSQTRTASDAHTKRAGVLQSIFNVDIENNLQGTDGLPVLLYVEQRDIISKWSRENSQIQQANRHLSSLHYTELPSGVERQIEVIEAIAEEQELRKTIERISPVADTALGQLWRGEQTDWNAAKPIINWMLNLYDGIDSGRADPGIVGSLGDGLDTGAIPVLSKRVRDALAAYQGCLEIVREALEMDFEQRFGHPDGLAGLPLGKQREILGDWSSRIHEIQDIAAVNIALGVAEKEGLQALTALVEEWPEAADHLTTCLKQTWYEHILSRAFGKRSVLAGFDGINHEAHREQFREMDTRVLGHNRARVAHVHWEGLPKHNGAGQLRILRREFEKKRRHLPIRQLMERAGNAIQAIKPVFMMSRCPSRPTWRQVA